MRRNNTGIMDDDQSVNIIGEPRTQQDHTLKSFTEKKGVPIADQFRFKFVGETVAEHDHRECAADVMCNERASHAVTVEKGQEASLARVGPEHVNGVPAVKVQNHGSIRTFVKSRACVHRLQRGGFTTGKENGDRHEAGRQAPQVRFRHKAKTITVRGGFIPANVQFG